MRRIRQFVSSLSFTTRGVTRPRIAMIVLAFAAVHLIIAGRLVLIGVKSDPQVARRVSNPDMLTSTRPDILDREGKQLATDVQSAMLYAEPRKGVGYVDDAVDQLRTVFPDLDERELRDKLSSKKGFVRLKREITAEQEHAVRKLGIPHVGFLQESKRVYPAGPEASHVLGGVNVDSAGIAGLEKWVDSGGLADLHMAGFATGRSLKPVQLSLDLDVQHAMRDELEKAKTEYQAKSTSGLVLDVRTGEIVAMVSLPDYDPNKPGKPTDLSRLNRLTTGVYEMGSTFKALTVAMALDAGKVTLGTPVDARTPLHYGRFTINDFHAQRRMLSVPEVFTYSSNIGAAKIALSMGVDAHKAFLRKMGQLDRLRTELPESSMPIVPKNWGEINTATISFGHGLAVAPLQAMMATAALVNGGYLIPPTFLKRSQAEAMKVAKRVIKPETSDKMRYLLRLNAEVGTAKRANVDGYYVGGKTGTSEKVVHGRYAHNRLLTIFTGVFPCDRPQYIVLVMVDEPLNKGHATAGLNAAPTAGQIIARIGPLLGVEPRFDLPKADQMLTVSQRAAN